MSVITWRGKGEKVKEKGFKTDILHQLLYCNDSAVGNADPTIMGNGTKYQNPDHPQQLSFLLLSINKTPDSIESGDFPLEPPFYL